MSFNKQNGVKTIFYNSCLSMLVNKLIIDITLDKWANLKIHNFHSSLIMNSIHYEITQKERWLEYFSRCIIFHSYDFG